MWVTINLDKPTKSAEEEKLTLTHSINSGNGMYGTSMEQLKQQNI
jgi:hypothetical protein